MRGATVCGKHGGMAPNVRKRAIVRAELAEWGLADTTEDPGELLLRLVAQSARRAAYYAELLRQQQERDAETTGVAQGLAELPRELRGLIGFKIAAAGKDGDLYAAEEAIRGLVVLEAQERDRCARFAKLALDAGIAERQVRLAEQQVDMVAAALSAAIAELGLSERQQREARAGVARHLRLAAG